MSGRRLLRKKEPQELYVRRARRNGRSVASLRALDYGDECVVEATIEVEEGAELEPRAYRFPDARQATSFVTDVVEAMMYLGCEIQAQ